MCYVGMLQPRENLPFAQKSCEYGFGIHAALYQLERDALLELAVGALRKPDHAHAAATQFAIDPPRPDAGADDCSIDQVLCLEVRCRRCTRCGTCLFESLCRILGLEHRCDDALQLCIVATQTVEQCRALRLRHA